MASSGAGDGRISTRCTSSTAPSCWVIGRRMTDKAVATQQRHASEAVVGRLPSQTPIRRTRGRCRAAIASLGPSRCPAGERSSSILYMLARRQLPSFSRNLSARRNRLRKLGFHVGAPNGGRPRWIVPATLMVFAAGILLSMESTLGQPTAAETKALDSIYYAALFSGRDPDAAVRKARYTAGTLMKQFGMTRPEAVAEIARFAIWRSGRLCGG